MDSITITINGLYASGPAGMTILELAREMGIFIPTLCYDPALSLAGACRICLVEEEKTGMLLASCVTPIAPGMVIQTNSPRVQENRRVIIKLMLANHPESCLICDKGNRCQLRQLAADLNIGVLDLDKLPNYSGTQEVNPFLRRDMAKCILCGKCIRADQELVVEGAIDYFQRGFAAKPATLHDQPLEKSTCTFCGTCVSLCPTGALSEKDKVALSSSLKSISSVCPYCACGCALSLGINGSEVIEVEPEKRKKTANQATLCVKGHYGWDFIKSKKRLSAPLIKRGDSWQECTWEEALNSAVEKLKKISAEHGPDALAFLGSSKCTNEENYLFQKLARCAIGTNNIDNGSRVYGPPDPGVFGPNWSWGTMSRPIADLEKAKCILVVSANPAESAPLVAYKIKRAVHFNKGKLILINPRWTRLVPFAQPWLQPKWGTEGLLVLGFIRAILEEELGELRNLEIRPGWTEFQREVNSLNLSEIVRETGIEAKMIRDCARDLALIKPMSMVIGEGLWQRGKEFFNLGALLNLSLITDQLGPNGGGIYPLGKDSNGQGARDMGCLPDFLPGYQSTRDDQVRKKFTQVWGKAPPLSKGCNLWEMLQRGQEGKIKGLYVMGENPLVSLPDRQFVKSALKKLDFLIVQDLFLTETAQLAHLILPAASFAEKEGTMTSAERRVQLLEKAAEPKGQGLADWKILSEILFRLGGSPLYASPREISKEINELVPQYGGITPERLEKESLYWPCLDRQDQGNPHFPGHNSSSTTLHFWPVKRGKDNQSNDHGEWVLIWDSTLFHFGSGTRSSQARRLRNFSAAKALQINAEEAKKRGLTEGSLVKIITPKGEIILPISLVKDLPPEVLFWPVTQGGNPVLELADFPQETSAKFPFSRSLKVQLERK